MNIQNLILAASFFLTITGNGLAASFDCSKAISEVEKLICGNDKLSKLDKSLNKAYLEALKRTDIKKRTMERQRQWLKNERNACQNAECLKIAYETRIKELVLLSSDGIVTFRPQPKTEQQHESTAAPDCHGADLSTKCFQCLAHKDLPFEMYPGLLGCDLYIQPLQKEYGFSTNSVPFIECADEIDATALCNGNFVATHNLPLALTGRSFDSSFRTVIVHATNRAGHTEASAASALA